MTWLVAGLGNPGERYARTRHNVGAMVVDELARTAGERFRKVRFLPLEIAETRLGDERVLLARSHRFMNEAGPSYASLAAKQHVEPGQVIAVHDELDLPFDRLKLGAGGGPGGHNGVKSIISCLGDPGFARVRIGIGRPAPGRDPSDWVLSNFSRAEAAVLPDVIARGADAVEAIVKDGLTAAMNRFNGKQNA